MVALQSDSIDQIAAALAAAQAEMEHLYKNAKNAYLGSKFADLAAVRAVCLPALNKHGIAVTQQFRPHDGPPLAAFETTKVRKDKDGASGAYKVQTQIFGYIRTQLTHSSGQWIASELPLACSWGDPHALGGTITYLRRYALAAMCGVAQEDDDGESAKGRTERREDRRPAAAPPPRRSAPPVDHLAALSEIGTSSPPPPRAEPVRKPRQVAEPAVAATPPPPAEPAPNNGKPRPETGLQLATYVNDNKIDPELKGWIAGRFGHRNYPARITDWTPAQVAGAWPDIRDHLRRIQLGEQITSHSRAAVPVG
jgi:ERF superfamily